MVVGLRFPIVRPRGGDLWGLRLDSAQVSAGGGHTSRAGRLDFLGKSLVIQHGCHGGCSWVEEQDSLQGGGWWGRERVLS